MDILLHKKETKQHYSGLRPYGLWTAYNNSKKEKNENGCGLGTKDIKKK